jgi:hypothetical protein
MRYKLLVSHLLLIFLTFGFSGKKQSIDERSFRHHFLATSLPGDERYGYGVSLLADLDKDGDLDFVTCVKQDSIYWFENKGSGEWERHAVGKINQVQLGSAIMDVDKDGWPDIIIGGYWYQNPQNPRNSSFKMYNYDQHIQTEIHDIATEDIDGDGQEEIIVLGDREGCYWYKIPPQPKQDGDWTRYTIALDVMRENDAIHSGFWPGGIGDLDNDGDKDIAKSDNNFSLK